MLNTLRMTDLLQIIDESAELCPIEWQGNKTEWQPPRCVDANKW